jgi:hypothetical protein
MTGSKVTHCSHGTPLFGDPVPRCIACELVWYRECHADAVRRVATTSRKISELEVELAAAALEAAA